VGHCEDEHPVSRCEDVEESVVDSKNAISEWEKRITLKEEKEKQQQEILGAGAARRFVAL